MKAPILCIVTDIHLLHLSAVQSVAWGYHCCNAHDQWPRDKARALCPSLSPLIMRSSLPCLCTGESLTQICAVCVCVCVITITTDATLRYNTHFSLITFRTPSRTWDCNVIPHQALSFSHGFCFLLRSWLSSMKWRCIQLPRTKETIHYS